MGLEPRHPAQLYEAMAYGLLFIIMLLLYKRQKSKVGTGYYFGLCLTYIFTFRFFVEFFKKTQVSFEDSMLLDMGQLLSVPFVILGVWCMWKARAKQPQTYQNP
jgi:prolipoprotein diacylglyceryltransferase